MQTGMKTTVDNLGRLKRDLALLASVEVLVGFPEDTTQRTDAEEDREITNAAIAYIQDNGAPEQNIPARPFMRPGMDDAKPKVINKFIQLARALVSGKYPDPKNLVEVGFQQVGLLAQAALRKKINEGIPPPLSEYTLRQRAARGRKGAKEELANRAKGLAPSTQLAKPLIDTAQLRNAVNYVIRNRKKRKG